MSAAPEPEAEPEPEPEPAVGPMVAANLAEVNKRIAAKCAALGREEPVLVAVSKTKPLEYVTAALSAGQHHFGENYIQELVEKSAALADNTDVKWHYIGQLQSNKVKMLVQCPNLALVHTVPSQKTAGKLNNASTELRPDNPLAVLVQVNTSGEESKGGVGPEEAAGLCQFIHGECDGLTLAGLMCIGKYGDDSSDDFKVLIGCRDAAAEALGVEASTLGLSMGMSHDFEQAIEYGAGYVRPGSTIFGVSGRPSCCPASLRCQLLHNPALARRPARTQTRAKLNLGGVWEKRSLDKCDTVHAMSSISDARISPTCGRTTQRSAGATDQAGASATLTMLIGSASRSLKIDSMTEISVPVVSSPHIAHQSLTTMPAPTTSEPRFTVPATSGTCRREDSSSCSSTEVIGCTMPPWFVNRQYDPTSTCPAIVWRNTSTPSTSAISSSVSLSMSVCTSAT